MELQTQVHQLVDETRELKDQNRALTEKLATRAEMVFRKNAYWHGDDGPFCSSCFDAEALVMRLHSPPGLMARCRKCGTTAPDPDAQPPRPAPFKPTSQWS